MDELLIDPEATVIQSTAADEVLLCHVLAGSITVQGIATGPDELLCGSSLFIAAGGRADLLGPAAGEPTRVLRLRIRAPQSFAAVADPVSEIGKSGKHVIWSDRSAVRSLVGTVLPMIREPSLTCVHVTLAPGAHWAWSLPGEQNSLAYVLEGSARFGASGVVGKTGDVLYFGAGERVAVSSGRAVEFVLIGGPEVGRSE